MNIPEIGLATESEVIAWLRTQDDVYENTGFAEVSDAEYDNYRRRAQLTYPANQYFTGVGSDVRGGKVKLAFEMNGLLELYDEEPQKLVTDTKTQTDDYVVSDKLDGTSAQIIYDAEGNLQIGYSRGNGTEAADITRHLRLIASLPKKIPATGKTFAVRAENIIAKNNWNTLLQCTKDRKKPYVNLRGAVAGIMNSSTNDTSVYQLIDTVAYTIIGSELSKSEQFKLLESYGFLIAPHVVISGAQVHNVTLTTLLNKCRDESKYQLDGVVVDHDVKQGTAFKYKVADATNNVVVVVKDVVYRTSKDGHIIPRIMIFPTVVCGVTVTYTNGFNAQYIKDNNIGPGTRLRMTRSGDVIPYILSVIEGTKAVLPDPAEFGSWSWNSSGVHAVLDQESDSAKIRKLTSSFSKLKIEGLKQATVEKLFNDGYTTFEQIINLDTVEWYMSIGENGYKIEESISKKLDNIYWPELVGCLELARGIGRRTMTELYNELKGDISKMYSVDEIILVPGFDVKSATPIADNIDKAIQILDSIKTRCKVRLFDVNALPAGTKMAGQNVVFTGVRSDDLESKIVAEGGVIGSGVSGNTTILVAKDVNSNSGKVKKARTINAEQKQEIIKIIGISALELMLL
jgi:DNA ligase (NAD+)